MSEKCDNCPANAWLCVYFNFKTECDKIQGDMNTKYHELCKTAAQDKVFKAMGVPEKYLDDCKVHSGVHELGNYTLHRKIAQEDRVAVVDKLLDVNVYSSMSELLKYFLGVPREFCQCAVKTFYKKVEKCDECKKYDAMVEKAKELLGRVDK